MALIRLHGLWSIYHIGMSRGSGTWPQLYGPFRPQGSYPWFPEGPATQGLHVAVWYIHGL